MNFLNTLIENSTMPWLTALVLGLMTAISPCPLATNITAIGFISRDLEDKKRVFYNGLFYTLGRALSYTLVAIILFVGASQMHLSGFFQRYSQKIIGPALIIIGLFMLDLIRVKFPGFSKWTVRMENRTQWRYIDALLLGMLFALAFCPYSGVLYFGMLIPMTVASASGLYLPIVFAVATGLPVIVFAWLLAFTLSGIGGLYTSLKKFELWFRRIIALLFIGVGIYYISQIYF
jgi:cytochrome c-type biogenesis protein